MAKKSAPPPRKQPDKSGWRSFIAGKAGGKTTYKYWMTTQSEQDARTRAMAQAISQMGVAADAATANLYALRAAAKVYPVGPVSQQEVDEAIQSIAESARKIANG